MQTNQSDHLADLVQPSQVLLLQTVSNSTHADHAPLKHEAQSYPGASDATSGFQYHAAKWKTARRVVAKIEFHCGELFLRVAFIVTTLEADSRAVVRFCNKRGSTEQWIKPWFMGRPGVASDFFELSLDTGSGGSGS